MQVEWEEEIEETMKLVCLLPPAGGTAGVMETETF
jgi:hypothetical protein